MNLNNLPVGFILGVSLTLLLQGLSGPSQAPTSSSSTSVSQQVPSPSSAQNNQNNGKSGRKRINVAQKADDLYQLLPKAKPLSHFPKSTEIWFRHFESEYENLSPGLQRMLSELAETDQGIFSKLLCKKNYAQYCEQFVEQLKLKIGKSGKSQGSAGFVEELQGTARYYLLTACKSYGGEACKQLSSWARNLPKDFRKEYSSFVFEMCGRGWIDGCLAYSIYLRNIGKSKKASRVAISICQKHNHCVEAGRMMEKKNPVQSAQYFLQDCLKNSTGDRQSCSYLLKKFPQGAHARRALDHLAKSCDSQGERGPASCTILANHYLKNNEPDLGRTYLEKGCLGGNQTACQFMQSQ